MSAPILTPGAISTGIREYSMVTNSFGGYLTSGGIAYNLQLPFFAHKIEWYNYTEWATNAHNIDGVWMFGMPNSAALITARGTTTLTSTQETANGVTNVSTPGGFAVQQLVISGITTASPAVVTTTTNHNLSNYDRVVITKVIGTMAQFINNHTYVVQVLSPTTVALYDVYGFPVDNIGAYTSSGELTKIHPRLGEVGAPSTYPAPQNAIQNYPPEWLYTLGTAIMGTAGDLIYFDAFHFNNYVNLGTLPT